MQRAFWKSLLLAAAIVAGGCDNELDPNPTDPAPTTTETFTGTININGAATHTVVISAAGRAVATLTAVTPDATIAVGFALGTYNSATLTCQQVLTKDDALQGTIHTGELTGPGVLCARIYDTGKLTEALTYTITIEHP